MGKLAQVQRTMLKDHVKKIKRTFNLAAVTAFLTIGSTIYIHQNRDDGEKLDLHDDIPSMVEKISRNNPKTSKAEIRKNLYNRATETENMMFNSGLMFSGISLMSCGLFYSLKRKGEKALDALPPSP